MLLLYAKYAFVFWLLVGSNHGDILLMEQLTNDEKLLQVAACTKLCLQTNNQHLSEHFRNCYVNCKADDLIEYPQLRKIQENFNLKLVCRTDVSLMFRIDWVEHRWSKMRFTNDTKSQPDALFILRVTTAHEPVLESLVYLSDENFITINKMTPETAHNVTALSVHANGEYSIIAKEQTFRTLERGYQPGKMGEIKLLKFEEKQNVTGEQQEYLAAQVEWQPSAERNCFYDLIWYSTDSQLMDMPVHLKRRDPRTLYTHTIDDLQFGQQYQLGVRTVNPKNNLESAVEWLSIQTPSCLEWFHSDYTKCEPLRPVNLSVQQSRINESTLSLNVSWTRPEQLPDYYMLHIFDLVDNGGQMLYNISQNANHILIPAIHILGASFEVHLAAHTRGGSNETDITVVRLPRGGREERGINLLLPFIIVPVGFIVIISSSAMYKRKTKLSCKQLEAQGQKPTSNTTDFHLSIMEESIVCLGPQPANISNTNFDDKLEVEPQQVLLQDVLGEGAFGLVRRGLYRKTQVAVKLLKSEPTDEDVQAFMSEIQMLKTMGRHPNIVGIVGYATKCDRRRMMLLIEYCSLGNLQNFLRDEWMFRQERQDKTKMNSIKVRHNRSNTSRIEDMNCSTMLEQIDEDAVLNTTPPAPPSKPPRCHFTAADNKSYGLNITLTTDANSLYVETAPTSTPPPIKHLKTVIVENKEYFNNCSLTANNDIGRKPLKYADLLDIAHQVASGMAFLAHNKVVHRDLAARNVLIALDRTIKIADFGLSRDVYHENFYRKSGGGKLPIKWLALESLTHQVYTSQSDVWSFGVLLYEITTLGGMPYPSVSTCDLPKFLGQGKRMSRPPGCSADLFALMESCWNAIPAHRPSFIAIKLRLGAMILAAGELPQRQLQEKMGETIKSNDDGHYLQPLK